MGTAAGGAPGASATAIQHHYDVGNEFYALWLDPGLTYSCGLWPDGGDLATAQRLKIEWHLEQAGVHPRAEILDIGCGWGALLRHAVERWGVRRAVGLTLSAAQAAWIAARHPTGIEVRLESWVEHAPPTPYDAIVSVGAFEHFARQGPSLADKLDGYRRFFSVCRELLKPGGRLSLQTITYGNADARDFSRFFAEEIFPESDLPHLWEIAAAVHGLFEIDVLRQDRADYVRTFRCWLEALRAHRGAAERSVGPAVVSKYERYFELMMVGFHTGRMNLARIGMRRIDLPARPLEILDRLAVAR